MSGAVVVTTTLIGWLAAFGVAVILAGIGLCLYRLVRGPTMADRGVALDAMGVQVLGLVVVLTLLGGELHFIDGMLVLALLSFAGTVAVAQFVARPFLRNAADGGVEDDRAAQQAAPHADARTFTQEAP